MPRDQRVIAVGKVLDRPLAIRAAGAEEGVIEHRDIGAHPRMDVALDVEILGHLRRIGHLLAVVLVGLGLVEAGILFRKGVNVVKEVVGVLHDEILPAHHGDDVRLILATLLVDHRGFLGLFAGEIG